MFEILLKHAIGRFEAKEYRIALCFFTEIMELFPVGPDVLRLRAKCYMNMVSGAHAQGLAMFQVQEKKELKTARGMDI